MAARAVVNPPSLIFPAEERLIARAGVKRRGEFHAGRDAARSALTVLGLPPSPILARKAGDPIWPSGVVGSITHTDQWAFAAAAWSHRLTALGIDLETSEPLEPDLVSLVCRPEERGVDRKLAFRGIDAGKLRFVAKEAFFKAVFPTVRRFIGFEEVVVRLDVEHGDFEVDFLGDQNAAQGEVRAHASGAFHQDDGLVCALCAW